MKTTVSILGCGWLGLSLAEYLLAQGYRVNGSTTSLSKIPLLEEKKIEPYLIEIDDGQTLPQEKDATFFESDVLIINIPPKIKLQGETYHPRQIATILRYSTQARVKKIIYISATSVYPPGYEAVDETTPLSLQNTGNKALLQAEKLLEKEYDGELIVFRCAGLLGYDRIPGKYYVGKTIDIGGSPVNYIHRDDVVRILEKSIRKRKFQGLYNLVAPLHPSRKDVFVKNAADFGFEPPQFSASGSANVKRKVVSGNKLMEELPYSFLYPDPLEFYYTP